jgi:hypothetical protein
VTNVLEAADLVGTWELIAWTSEGEDGVLHPMGEDPEGVLVYTSDGTMITTIGRRQRPAIDGGDLLSGPLEQRLDAMETFIAYAGTFRVDGGDVLHDVAMSLFPNWIGTTQRRHVAIDADGDELVLSADPFVLRGRLSTQRLTWRRVAGSPLADRL